MMAAHARVEALRMRIGADDDVLVRERERGQLSSWQHFPLIAGLRHEVPQPEILTLAGRIALNQINRQRAGCWEGQPTKVQRAKAFA